MGREEALKEIEPVSAEIALAAYHEFVSRAGRHGRCSAAVLVNGRPFHVYRHREASPVTEAPLTAWVFPQVEYEADCSHCDGEGVVEKMGRFDSHTIDPPIYDAPCDHCEGRCYETRREDVEEIRAADGRLLYPAAILLCAEDGRVVRVSPGGEVL